MYKSIKAIVAVIIVTATFYLIAITILFKGINKFELDYSKFEQQQAKFNECYDNSETQLATDLYHTDLLQYDEAELAQIMLDSFQTACDTTYTISSEGQISDMAMYIALQTDLQLLDTVYTTSSSYYAIVGVPQEYLFFAMNEDKTSLAAYVVIPTDEYNYIEIFNTTNLDEAKIKTQYLLLFYNEQVR